MESMEIDSERKNLKRKAEELGNELEAETKENSEISAAANNDILDLCDDIVLGGVITRLPWYNRPVIMAFSRGWADAMTHSFPCYARLQQPRFLSSCLVLFHNPASPDYPAQNSQILWVYCDTEGALFNLPVPAIPEESRNAVKFMRDDNDERVFCFTPIEEHGHRMYNVRVYDLREGNLQWKILAPLPMLDDHSLLNCSSFDNGGRCTTYYIVIVPTVINNPLEDFAVWSLTVRNDGTEWQSQWQREVDVSPELIDKVLGFDLDEDPPVFLEFTLPNDSGNPQKCLYEMCEHREYSTEYLNGLASPHHLFMQFQDDGSHSPRTSNCTLYYIRVSERERESELSLYKVQLGEDNSTWIDSFDEFWRPWMPFLGPRMDSNALDSNALKISSTRLSEWDKKVFTFSDAVDLSAIKLVPKGTLFVFRLAAAVTNR